MFGVTVYTKKTKLCKTSNIFASKKVTSCPLEKKIYFFYSYMVTKGYFSFYDNLEIGNYREAMRKIWFHMITTLNKHSWQLGNVGLYPEGEYTSQHPQQVGRSLIKLV